MKKNLLGKIASTFIGLILIAACGNGDSTDSATETGSSEYKDSYQFSQNGCNTGKQEFTAKDATALKQKLCTALKDDSQNKNCASDLRKQHFDRKCSGYQW